MARMQEQLERHREAWMTGVRTRYISEDARQGRHDPQFDNWDDMEEHLQQLWHDQYETQLRIFLAMYRDYLLRLLATWFDSFGVPCRDHNDDDYHIILVQPAFQEMPIHRNIPYYLSMFTLQYHQSVLMSVPNNLTDGNCTVN